jgi:aldose 1-epimerase
MQVRNEESHRMIFGVGLHPYFANRHLATITACLPVRWRWDQEMMPLSPEMNPFAAKFQRGHSAGELPVAAEYADWDGKATIEWPTLRTRIELETTPRLKHVVMWAPESEDFFCVEPICHATDALALQNGQPPYEDCIVLDPQRTYEQCFDFSVTII